MQKEVNCGVGLRQRVEVHRWKSNMNYSRQLVERRLLLRMEHEDRALDANHPRLASLNLLVLVKSARIVLFSRIPALAKVLLRIGDNGIFARGVI